MKVATGLLTLPSTGLVRGSLKGSAAKSKLEVPLRLRTLPIAVVLALVCASCGSDSGGSHTTSELGSDSGGSHTTSAPPPAVFPPVATAGNCTSSPQYAEIPLSPETVYEQWLAPTLRVCYRELPSASDGSRRFSLEVINAGPAVWVVDGFPPWGSDALNSGPEEVVLFRHASNGGSQGLAVEPGRRASATVDGNYSPRLHLDAAMQAKWETISRSVKAIEKRTKSSILNLQSPEVRAAITCGQSAYATGQKLTSINSDTTGGELLQQVFDGVASAQSCQQAIDEAEKAAKKASLPVPLAIEDFKVTAIDGGVVAERAESSLVSALKLAKFLEKVPKRL